VPSIADLQWRLADVCFFEILVFRLRRPDQERSSDVPSGAVERIAKGRNVDRGEKGNSKQNVLSCAWLTSLGGLRRVRYLRIDDVRA